MTSARDIFDRDALARICAMHETDFAGAFGFERHAVDQPAPDDFYLFRDNGRKVLAVAHLDTVGRHEQRAAHFLDTAGGEVVYSRALDDRLGATVILDMLPKLGIEVDVLLTVGEETGRSTAQYFEPRKSYDWMIEFDRGGTDVVMYQYDDVMTRELVRQAGAVVGDGIFSDIRYLDHLGIKGFNWGVGYREYHGPRAHAYLDDLFDMVDRFAVFHDLNVGQWLPHDEDAWLDDTDDDTWITNNARDPFFWASDADDEAAYDEWARTNNARDPFYWASDYSREVI